MNSSPFPYVPSFRSTYKGLILLMLTVSACQPPLDQQVDGDGVVIKAPPLWKTPISDNNQLAEVVISAPIQYGDGQVLVGATRQQQRSIRSLGAQDGVINWDWSDLLSIYGNPAYKDPISIHLGTFYQTATHLFFPYATSSYCINLTSGTTAWKHKTELARFDISAGIGQVYFSAGGSYGVGDDERLYSGTLSDPTPEGYLLTPHYQAVAKPFFNGFGRIKGLVPFIQQGDTLLAVLFNDPSEDTRFVSYSVNSLYNISKQRWVYERTVMNPSLETGNILYPLLYKSKLYYASGRGLHCYDVLTGQSVWSVAFSQGFGFSGFILVDDKLIANCEDTYLYCLDPATGRQVWKEKSSGSSTPMSYLNGVVYFAGGGDGKLHAVDATSGQHLWRLKSPDETAHPGAWFYGVCVAVAGRGSAKGRIVATTGLHAYGYEAIR